MKPRRLLRETRVSMVTDMKSRIARHRPQSSSAPSLGRRAPQNLSPPRTRGRRLLHESAPGLRDESRRTRKGADEPAHHPLDGGDQFRVEVRGEREPDTLLPAEGPEPLQEAYPGARQVECIGAWSA